MAIKKEVMVSETGTKVNLHRIVTQNFLLCTLS